MNLEREKIYDVASHAGWLPFYQRLTYVRPGFLAMLLKKVCGIRRRVVKTKHGAFYLDPASNFGLDILADGEYEPAMTEVLTAFLKPAGVFVDVGANEGYFSTLAAALVSANGKVFAVEPQARLQSIIAANLALNRVTNTRCLRYAISNRHETVKLYLSPNVNTGTSSLTQTLRYRMPFEQVEALTLDELLARHEIAIIDLLKMDVEGFEYEAVLGAPQVFRQHRVRAFALELHPREIAARGLDVSKVTTFLEDCGYQVDSRFENLVYVAPS